MPLIYQDRTRQLKQMFFNVQNEVGLGRHEEAYQRACELWLEEQRIPFATKPPLRLMLGADEAHVLFPDLIVWDSITVELKSLPRKMSSGDIVQLYDYLRFRNDRVGFLVNQGLDRVHDIRVAFDRPNTQLSEDWTYWSGHIDGHEREIGLRIRDGIRFLYDAHGTGYGDEVFERLLVGSITRLGFNVLLRPISKAHFRGVEVHNSALDCIVVENRLLIAFTALFDDVQFSINRGLSYMRSLGLEWGVAIDFGKHAARIVGLRQRARI